MSLVKITIPCCTCAVRKTGNNNFKHMTRDRMNECPLIALRLFSLETASPYNRSIYTEGTNDVTLGWNHITISAAPVKSL